MTSQGPEGSGGSTGDASAGGPVVLLAGPGDSTDIVANYLARHVQDLVVVLEGGQSRTTLARRRAKRMGWLTVTGQTLFVVLALPALRWRGRERRAAILEESGLDATPYPPDRTVTSVNADETVAILQELGPSVVVVNGTRIIAKSVLGCVDAPFVNIHAGITPQYRGVHGGYWALAEGHPELVGTTVHLVDPGIDTGTVLSRAYFATTPQDSIATYPYLHLAAGLPQLGTHAERAAAGEPLTPVAESEPTGPSHLFTHPTLLGYLRRWWATGTR